MRKCVCLALCVSVPPPPPNWGWKRSTIDCLRFFHARLRMEKSDTKTDINARSAATPASAAAAVARVLAAAARAATAAAARALAAAASLLLLPRRPLVFFIALSTKPTTVDCAYIMHFTRNHARLPTMTACLTKHGLAEHAMAVKGFDKEKLDRETVDCFIAQDDS